MQSAEQQSASAGTGGVSGRAQPGTQSQTNTSGNAVGNSTNSQAVSEASNSADQDGVVHRVIPEVSPAARRSIQGRIVLRVKVKVDPAGDVEKASVVSGHVSKYFSRVALEAARDWKFAAANNGAASDRQWMLQFAFTRAKTDVSANASNH